MHRWTFFLFLTIIFFSLVPQSSIAKMEPILEDHSIISDSLYSDTRNSENIKARSSLELEKTGKQYNRDQKLYFSSNIFTPSVAVTGVRLSEHELTLLRNDTAILHAFISPHDATNREVEWYSSNNYIVQVYALASGQSGNLSAEVKALSPGHAMITVVTEDGNKRATCQIQVLVPVRSIKLTPTEITLDISEKFMIHANIEPTEGTNPFITWESSNSAVAIVDDRGMVEAREPGEARIIARSVQDNRITAYCLVKVRGTTVKEEEEEEEKEDEEDAFILITIIAICALLATMAVVVRLKTSKKSTGKLSTAAPHQSIGTPVIDKPLSADRLKTSILEPTPLGKTKTDQPVGAIKGISGYFRGQPFDIKEKSLLIGRDPKIAHIVYPQEKEEISRKHLVVRFEQKTKDFILEDYSTNGTYLASNQRLERGKPYTLKPGDRFYLSHPGEMFELMISKPPSREQQD